MAERRAIERAIDTLERASFLRAVSSFVLYTTPGTWIATVVASSVTKPRKMHRLQRLAARLRG